MAVTPYVSAAAFRAHPTSLDLDGLVDSADPADQDAELTNLLLTASEWADSECDQPLGAHVTVQRERILIGRSGRLMLHADHGPVRRIQSVGYGWTQNALTVLSDPSVWVEQDSNIVISIGGSSIGWSGSLQFGQPVAGGEVFVQADYVAGWAATVLDEGASAGDVALQVQDPTGFIPGARYRIWEPGVEETVTVDPSWSPPLAVTSPLPADVPLADPLRSDHAPGHDLSGMPADLRLAIVQYTIALLMRPDSSAEDEFPENTTSTTRGSDTRPTGMGQITSARRNLSSYRRVR
ncbi:hypothetical protein HY68_01655 [Streptomyces sp. AcH 505]|uniref:hypothetical protein n=1 Tax=Streptomyces sp. AcH 505 TaxID=352211 RepID=UPI000591E4F0|nr:hypothetical protein HY68_01655 [Streptomyces sp. AcH 505]